jgi:diamine N-acetyltransferase
MNAQPGPARPMIRGARVFLRASERADIPTFVRWLNDGETASYLSLRAPMSEAQEEGWYERMLAAQGRDGYHFVICRLEDGLAVGTIGLFELDANNGSAGLGISIGEKQLWSQGLGTDAVLALLDFGFGELRLERIWLDVFESNPRARRSYEKCGFVVEGTKRRAVYRQGTFQDIQLMSILREEWSAQQRKRSWDYTDDKPAP